MRRLSTKVRLDDGRVLDAARPDECQTLLRMMVESNYPGGWSYGPAAPSGGVVKFSDTVDPTTLRPVVLASRHVETGTWILRVDALSKAQPHPRRKPLYGTPEYAAVVLANYRFTFFEGDYGGLQDLICRWRANLLPVTVAHYAAQMFGPGGLAASWPART